MRFVFEQIRTGGDRNFAYLVGDRDERQAVVVDPSYSPDLVVERATAQGLTVVGILNTHGHPDHVNGNARARELTGAPVVAHPGGAVAPDHSLRDDDELRVGGLALRCLHTPGHCPDHVVFWIPELAVALTGDLLFVGKVGGTRGDDDAKTELASLQRLLLTLPDETTIWPGHDYGCRPSSTIGLERRTNPFLCTPDLAAFLELKRDWATFKAEHGLR